MTDILAEDPLIGQQLANFRLERVIGRGGMATVYYARDVKLNRPVAVKVIDARYRGNPSYAERFIRESQVVATWRHSNILQVYYADDQSDLYYFVMEYINGLDLRGLIDQYLEDNAPMPYDDVLRIGFSVADALDYAHTRGVIHRDVKPSNVMVSFDGRVLLMDFGLALQITEGSMGEVFGTPHYMAPEQARRSADAVSQSDLYSLGILLYEMLTGSIPFDDQSPTSVAIMHITQPPPLPREINPNLSVSVERVLLKMLEKDPKDRYQTGGELMDALQQALLEEGAGVSDLPPLPAMVQRQMDSGVSFPRRSSNMTVAERLALQFDTQTTIDEPLPLLSSDPFADTVVDVPRQLTTERNRPSWFRYMWVIGVVLFVLGLGGGIGWQFFAANGGGDPLTPAGVVGDGDGNDVAAVVPLAETDTPTPTDTATVPPTSTPTEEPTSAPTEIPTETPVNTPTFTPEPTATPVVTPTFILIYDNDTFYMRNITDERMDSTVISFVALDDEGDPTIYGFAGAEWRFPRIVAGWCNGLEVGRSAPAGTPAECDDVNSFEFPGEESTDIFWITRPDEGVTRFDVQLNGVTVQTCATVARRCTIALP